MKGQHFKRIDWDSYFMILAQATSKRATCERKQVGAVIVKDNIILSTGYNGTASGDHECRGVDYCTNGKGHGCIQTIHAEQNALMRASMKDLKGSTVYVTLSPCLTCFKMLKAAGVRRIVYMEEHSSIDDVQIYNFDSKRIVVLEQYTQDLRKVIDDHQIFGTT